MIDLNAIEDLVRGGESESVEFKKTTGQLPRAGKTLCAFLNGEGGRVFIGVTPEGRVVGQQIADSTLQDIATVLDRFEPAAPISQEIVPVGDDRSVIVLAAPSLPDVGPFVYDGRPYQRLGNTTSVMPQSRYETLLLQRAHSRTRWENARSGITNIGELDHEEILRTVRLGVEAGRLPESIDRDIPDILDRLGLREEGELLNAAIVLFGTTFMPGYPQ